jgi:subtilase family serine protease
LLGRRTVANRGFATAPNTTVAVVVYDLQSRRLLMAKSLNVPATQPNQTRRAIVVPPQTGQAILVRATVDPGNRVPESNERNNVTASRH